VGGIFYNDEASDDLLFGRGDEGSDIKSCRYCGAPGLHWEQIYGSWRLCNDQNKPHTCEAYKKHAKRNRHPQQPYRKPYG